MDPTNFIIAVDDTDTPEEGGTGKLCRELAQRLSRYGDIWGVTRHQLAVLPGIPYTRRNSANAIHLVCAPRDFREVAEYAIQWVAEHCCPGSEPGLCMGTTEALKVVAVGRAAQQRVVSVEEAWQAARAAEVTLRSVLGSGQGVVGALAAAALASCGNDGRFVEREGVRDLHGSVAVAEVLAAGVDEVRTADGETLTEGEVIAPRGLRPALCEGKCLLFVTRQDDHWLPLKGWPCEDLNQVRVEGDIRDL